MKARRKVHSHFPMTMVWLVFAAFVLQCSAFVVIPSVPQSHSALYGDRFNRDLEERSRQRAAGQGSGEMLAGAVLGTLVAGPFGTFFVVWLGRLLSPTMTSY